MTNAAPLILDGSPLTPADLEGVARDWRPVRLAPEARARAEAARGVIESHLNDGQAHYGINTGFGSLSKQRIPEHQLKDLQRNLVRSHAAGVGDPLSPEIVRGMLLLLGASLARGQSGVRPELVELILGMLNAGVTPVVPELGSVGASGDLAPLAHAALVMIGEGSAIMQGATLPGDEALRRAGLAPIDLEAKEGLALINGTHLMAAQAALLVRDADRLLEAAVIATAMSLDACRATDSFLDARVHAVRAHPAGERVAERLREALTGSEIIPSHRFDDARVQDPYSIRCAVYVLGAASELLEFVRMATGRELGAVTDNPLVFDNGDVISAGNFHGMPIALPLDTLALVAAHAAGISERRTYLMLSAMDPDYRLTPYLTREPGVQSGLMIAQYTAAACCNEIIGLCTPATVSNIPTSAGIEDYNSFGPRAAAKARRAIELARHVVAIELLCAAEAIEHHRPLKSGVGVERAHAAVRSVVPRLDGDRTPSPDIAAIERLIQDGSLA
ncbi:MAG: histidine ammonia-lyase [Phycisphaerales bacterium]|nr:MAG: histidine ammonia-lyase [Phycisphaerales bacterium]